VKFVLALSALLITSATLFVPFGQPAGADQVSSLQAQAKLIAQELVQEQLQAGAYQQQYSVASDRVASDQRGISATQQQIRLDRRAIATRSASIRRLAIRSYVLAGSVSSSSGEASLFAQNVQKLQSANEYATISIGDLNLALAQLHTAQRAVQAQQAVLLQQQSQDQAEQSHQAQYLAQATATASRMQVVQAKVTGQLVAAVAQQNAAQAAAAAAAVAAAQRVAAQQASTHKAAVAYVSSNTSDPALNPFLQCVRQAESGGNYAAVSPNGEYMGAFQFSQPTWDYAAQAAGRPDLVGVPPNVASRADQDTMAVALYSLDGERPWLGDRCTTA
jgi:hypothetical protein